MQLDGILALHTEEAKLFWDSREILSLFKTAAHKISTYQLNEVTTYVAINGWAFDAVLGVG